jgi:hypothetical protein
MKKRKSGGNGESSLAYKVEAVSEEALLISSRIVCLFPEAKVSEKRK